MNNAMKPLSMDGEGYKEFRPFELKDTTAAKEDAWMFTIQIEVCTYSGYSTILPGISKMLKAYFNKGLETQLANPSELNDLKGVIETLDKAAEYEWWSEELKAKIDEALLWIACNWDSLWL